MCYINCFHVTCCSERDAARLQVMETERKFRAALCQIKFHKNDLAIFRWFRMTSLLQIRQLERNSSKRVSGEQGNPLPDTIRLM